MRTSNFLLNAGLIIGVSLHYVRSKRWCLLALISYNHGQLVGRRTALFLAACAYPLVANPVSHMAEHAKSKQPLYL